MRTHDPRTPRRRLTTSIALAALAVAMVACSAAAPSDGPGAVVNDALAKVEAKDIAGLRTLACAGQEDRIRDQLGLPGAVGADLLPGLDTQALLDAVNLDVGGVKVGDATVDGDTAQVPVSGNVAVTFDATKARPVLKQVLAQQGSTMTDEQIDALLKMLEAYGQDVPLDQSIRLVREGGAWKICQDSLQVPASPSAS